MTYRAACGQSGPIAEAATKHSFHIFLKSVVNPREFGRHAIVDFKRKCDNNVNNLARSMRGPGWSRLRQAERAWLQRRPQWLRSWMVVASGRATNSKCPGPPSIRGAEGERWSGRRCGFGKL